MLRSIPRLRCYAVSPSTCLAKQSLQLLGLSILFALGVGFCPTRASAQTCLQQEYKAAGNTQTLSCTANDVRVAKVVNVRDLNGHQLMTCNANTPFSFIADFLVQTTSKSSRSNIGLYFATGDVTTQTNALSGSCSDNIIPPASYTCAGSSVTCGSSHPDEFDASTDNCGDTSSSDPTVCLDANNRVVSCPAPAGGSTWTATQIVTVEIDNFPCIAPTGTTQLVIPNCTSWQTPGSATLCQSSSPSYPWVPAAIPGSPSKCNCSTIPLGITVQTPGVTLTKNCATNDGSSNWTDPTVTPTTPGCSITPEGGDVTYTIGVSNTSNFGSIVIDQVCDTAYGTVYRSAGAPSSLAACAAGSQSGVAINSTTCNSTTLGMISTTASCSFTVTQAENLTVSDTVSMSGHGVSAGTFGPNSSNSVTVISGEAPTTGTVSKSMNSTTAGCVTVRYSVDVKNTSATGTDETLSLSGLNDNQFGDITKWTGTGNSLVLGTTCGASSSGSGLGTLSGSSGAGAFPTTLAINGDYSCQFDAQFCGPLATVPVAGTGMSGACTDNVCAAGEMNISGGTSCTLNTDCLQTCTGIYKTDTASATVKDDEGNAVSLTPARVTVSQCFPPASQQ